MLSLPTLLVPAFLLGLLLGSFVNVLISRLPHDGSIVTPRSRCLACGHPIRPWDNIPLLSWALLRGRCRDCQARISWRYPAVELLTGLWFTLVADLVLRSPLFHEVSRAPHAYVSVDGAISIAITALSLLTLGCLLIALLVTDWETQLLPNTLTIPGILLGVLFTCAHAALLPTGTNDWHFSPRSNLRLRSPGSFAARGDVFLTGTERMVYGRVAAVLAVVLLLLLVRWIYRALRHREGMGLGDVKLLALLAAFLGFWPAVLSFFLAVCAAAVLAVVLLVAGRAGRSTRLPFGSFLAAAGLFASVAAGPILTWYKSLLR